MLLIERIAAVSVAAILATASPATASFITYQGGATQEAAWQAAAGSTVIETFDSFAQGTSISSLPLLGVGFDELAPGLYPAVYLHSVDNTPSGPLQLSNMPTGSPQSTYQYIDMELRVLAGRIITALGFWNGDPQGDMVISVYDSLDNLLGTATAATNIPGGSGDTFAGFVSSVPIARVHFEGQTGDGWNHIDDLQTNVSLIAAVSEPASLPILGLALIGLCWIMQRRQYILVCRQKTR